MSGRHEGEIQSGIRSRTTHSEPREPARRADENHPDTDMRQVGNEPHELHGRFESAFNNAPIGMALLDLDGRWLQVNSALCLITGYTQARLLNTTLRAITHPEDVGLDKQGMRALLAGEAPNSQCEKRYLHAWGHYVWVQETTSIVRDKVGLPQYCITQVQDISERKELARRLEHVVDHDFLTGLFNRRFFEQALAREAERIKRYGGTGAVLMVDLDHFKEINDTFGHRAGDDVLTGVASLLRQRLRSTDIVARVGGDEFAVLLTQTDPHHVQLVADELVKALARETALLSDHSVRITASVGVAMIDGHTDIEVLACADLAMYEAKQTGRDRFEMHRPQAHRRGRGAGRPSAVEHLRDVVAGARLILFCQPISNLNSPITDQYELLLRVPDEEGGEPLPPSAFLSRAERSGMIQAIDGWVVMQAISLIEKQAGEGRRVVLHVNLSGKSIGDPDLVRSIEKALAHSGIAPDQLVLELTETAAIPHFEDARTCAARLRAIGCRFALDDFGAGFGSFYYLKSFPFDFLKIDGDFIRGLETEPMNQLVVSAIVSIARGVGMKTVAEYVTDPRTERLLRDFGVDHAQGFHIGIPRPVSEVLPMH